MNHSSYNQRPSNHSNLRSRGELQRRGQRWNVFNAKSYPSIGPEGKVATTTLIVGKNPSIVAKSVDEFLRLSSIETQFNNHTATAICKTIDYTHFLVSLYSDPNSDQNTYIDVVKLKGNSFSFRKYKNDLMEAVGGSASTNNANHRGLRRVMKRTRNDGAADGEETISNPRMKKTMRFKMLPDLEASYTPPSRNELENIVMRAGDKLHSNNSATVLFTLQHLASMTSPKSDRTAETVHILSELIMENKHQLWNKVAAIYAAHSNNNLKNEEISLQIMNACLRIVSNVLLSGLVTSRERRRSQNLNVESIFIDHFIPLLTDTVAQYTHTYNACLAMKCIAMLVDNSSHARQRVSEVSNIGFVMEQAMLYGCTTNLMLQQTATSTIETFRHHLIM